ncbi:MAG: hypothetical protein ACYTGD_11390 [Planctomycetota bacterium]|jgi:hypothetical protein
MRRSRVSSFLLGVAALPAATAAAVGPPCEPFWSDQFPASRLDRWVWELAVFDDGSGPEVYAGGGFTVERGSPADHIARLDGNVWQQVGGGLNSDAQALAPCQECPDPGPNLYAGGYFTQAGEVEVSSIARWDGTTWSPLGAGIGGEVYGFIFALTVANAVSGEGPILYAGGAFTTAGGSPVNNIAQWNGASWSPLGDGVDGTVRALVVVDDGSGSGPALYAAGHFSGAGGLMVNNIARWDGANWDRLGNGLDDSVYALAIFDDGSGPALYAGGTFTHAGAVEATGIARWDGSAWSAVGGSVDGDVFALAARSSGPGGTPTLYVGGSFSTAGSVEASGIASWDGTSWSPLGSGTGGVWGIAVLDDEALDEPIVYAGGFFHQAGDVDADYVAKWDGASWSELGNGVNETVLALEASEGNSASNPSLYAGGEFTTAGSVAAESIATWDGSEWLPVGEGLEGFVRALCVFEDGSGPAPPLYAGGSFADPDGGQLGSIARWDGEQWQGVSGGIDGNVCALEVHDDGTGPALYVGGIFTEAGGVQATNIARWDGAAWSPVGEGLPGGDYPSFCAVQDMIVYDDGSGPALYACGTRFFEGNDDICVVKWDGSTWSPLPDALGLVFALAVFDDGQGGGPALYAGGYFCLECPEPEISLAKWDGSSWSAVPGEFVPSPYTPWVRALAVYDDGTGRGTSLYVGGDFSAVDGVPASHIASWNGTEWSPLGDGIGAAEDQPAVQVLALTVFDDDAGEGPALFAGGLFDRAGGQDSWNIAKWGGCAGPSPGDLDGDGIVGLEDFEILLEAWGPCPQPCPPGCPADLDEDCSVGITDFLIMLALWG